MSDSRDVQWTVLIALWALCCATALAAVVYATAHAQEKPERETRQWVLSRVGDHIYNYQRVVAIDTEGVCLYVVTNENSANTAIAAVPKTQLPKGAGCQ